MVSVTAVLVIIAFVCILCAKIVRPPNLDFTWIAVLLLCIVHLLTVIIVGVR
jgi:hypothetical protein